MPLNYDDASWRRMTERGDWRGNAQWRHSFARLGGRRVTQDGGRARRRSRAFAHPADDEQRELF